MRGHVAILTSAVLAGVSLCASCGGNEVPEKTDDDILVSVGDSSLTLREVLADIPSGISPEDSTEMFHAIVDNWIRDLMLYGVAVKNVPDIDRIERLVNDYRNNLIIASYLRQMEESGEHIVREGDIRKYYDSHKEELILEQPLVKGVFLKVPDNDENLPRLRKWMASPGDEAVDNIEKHGLKQASQYEYFMDTWQEWNRVADQIPYKFFDADAFVSDTRDFETTYGGSAYILHISEYLGSGSRMPYEYARGKISGILLNAEMSKYRNSLINALLRKEMENGTLRAGLYDPVSGRMRDNENKEKKTDKR